MEGLQPRMCGSVGDILSYTSTTGSETTQENAFLSVFKPHPGPSRMAVLLNKRPGLLCHADEHEKGEHPHPPVRPISTRRVEPQDPSTPLPALCSRIDRNTAASSRAAKNAGPAHRQPEDQGAIVHGRLKPSQGSWRGFLPQDEDRAQVKVFSRPRPAARAPPPIRHSGDGGRTVPGRV